jgi:hypothetical protein
MVDKFTIFTNFTRLIPTIQFHQISPFLPVWANSTQISPIQSNFTLSAWVGPIQLIQTSPGLGEPNQISPGSFRLLNFTHSISPGLGGPTFALSAWVTENLIMWDMYGHPSRGSMGGSMGVQLHPSRGSMGVHPSSVICL